MQKNKPLYITIDGIKYNRKSIVQLNVWGIQFVIHRDELDRVEGSTFHNMFNEIHS
jgi:hypothetical protein